MPVEGTGLHRLWYVGGRWAYASALLDGFSDYILITIDLKNPKKPLLAGKYWLPGMNVAAGEKADWPTERPLRPAPRHHPRRHRLLLVARRLPRRGRRQGQDQPEADHPQGLGAAVRRRHPQRAAAPDRNLLIVVDETVLDNQEDGFKPIWVFDNQVKSNPISIATFPAPSDKDYLKVGGHFGPHNVHENRPGSFQSSELIFATYQNAGLRVYDIRDQFRPKEVGAFFRRPEEMGGPATQPPGGAALRRRLRGPQRALLRDRLQRRALHRRIQGLTRPR